MHLIRIAHVHLIRVAHGATVLVLLTAGGCGLKTNRPGILDPVEPNARRSVPIAAGVPEPAVPSGLDDGDGAAVGPFAAETIERGALIEAVLLRNSTLVAVREAWNAARHRPDQVSAFDDPMVGYSIAPLSIGSSRVDFGETADVAQRFPWPGKLRLKGKVAVLEAEARWHDYESARRDIALAASDLFDDYYVVDRALEINSEHVRLLEEFKRAATARYAAGLLSQQDPIQAEVELAHLAHQEVVLSAARRVIIARCNALLHRSPAAHVPPPARAPPSDVPGRMDHAQSDQVAARLENLALASRPELAAMAAEIEARQADVQLAALEGFPDFGVVTSYNTMWASEKHRWMAGFNLNLPIWRDRIRAGRLEASARVAAAEAQRRALADEVRSAVRQSFERLRESHHVTELFRSRLLPAARDQVQAARSGVESGTNSFLALIEAEKNLRDVELEYEVALANGQRRLAELARHVGRFPGEAADLLCEVSGEGTVAEHAAKGDPR